MSAQTATLQSLSAVMAAATTERRADVAERVYRLFAAGAEAFSEQHIELFDEVFLRLVDALELSVRVSLAGRLADMPQAPPAVTRILAFDDAIAVAGPVLARSARLDSAALAENARSKSQPHLLAISKRLWLEECVTDVLVKRGDRPVILSTTRNSGARFSDFGYGTLVRRAGGDDELAGIVGARADLPRVHLLRLLADASEVVRRKLEAADPLSSGSIRSAIATTVNKIRAKAEGASRDYVAARTRVEALLAAGKLDDAVVGAFARERRFEETAVALALLAELPLDKVEAMVLGGRPESLVILAKAIGMAWPNVKAILGLFGANASISEHQLDLCLGTFSRLKPATARQILEFQRRRRGANDSGLAGERSNNT